MPSSQNRPPMEMAEVSTLPAVLDAYAAVFPGQEFVIADDRGQTAGFRTGDLGWIGGAEQLHFSGRGERGAQGQRHPISPAEVETVIMRHPDIDQVYAFGCELPDQDEDSCAAPLSSGPARPDRTERSRPSCAAGCASRSRRTRSRRLFVVIPTDGVPTTDTGKVSKRLIGERLIKATSTRPQRSAALRR